METSQRSQVMRFQAREISKCLACGYPLAVERESGRLCSECGTAWPHDGIVFAERSGVAGRVLRWGLIALAGAVIFAGLLVRNEFILGIGTALGLGSVAVGGARLSKRKQAAFVVIGPADIRVGWCGDVNAIDVRPLPTGGALAEQAEVRSLAAHLVAGNRDELALRERIAPDIMGIHAGSERVGATAECGSGAPRPFGIADGVDASKPDE